MARVGCGEGGLEREARAGDNADAAPVRVHHVEDVIEQAARRRVAIRADHAPVAIGEPRLPGEMLAEHFVQGRKQALGVEPGHRRRHAVPFGNEAPLLGAHHRRDMPRGDQRGEAGRLAFEQHGDRGPGAAGGEQEGEIVRNPLGEQRGDRRGGGLEPGGEEDDLARGEGAGDAEHLLRRGDRTDIAPRGARLFERAGRAAWPVDRHAQHVAKGEQGDVALADEGDGGADVFFRTDADRATGAGDEFDGGGQGAAQSGE